MNIKAGALKG